MWKKISSKVVFDHPRMKLSEDQVQLPDGPVVPYLRDANTDRHSVTLVCVRDGLVLVQREYSYPPNQTLYQFPGGKVNQKEGVLEAARRELVEESGMYPHRVRELGWYYTDNRRSNAKMHVILAEDCEERPREGGDLEESIQSQWIEVEKLRKMIAKKQITNYSILAAWSLWRTA